MIYIYFKIIILNGYLKYIYYICELPNPKKFLRNQSTTRLYTPISHNITEQLRLELCFLTNSNNNNSNNNNDDDNDDDDDNNNNKDTTTTTTTTTVTTATIATTTTTKSSKGFDYLFSNGISHTIFMMIEHTHTHTHTEQQNANISKELINLFLFQLQNTCIVHIHSNWTLRPM